MGRLMKAAWRRPLKRKDDDCFQLIGADGKIAGEVIRWEEGPLQDVYPWRYTHMFNPDGEHKGFAFDLREAKGKVEKELNAYADWIDQVFGVPERAGFCNVRNADGRMLCDLNPGHDGMHRWMPVPGRISLRTKCQCYIGRRTCGQHRAVGVCREVPIHLGRLIAPDGDVIIACDGSKTEWSNDEVIRIHAGNSAGLYQRKDNGEFYTLTDDAASCKVCVKL